MTQIYALAHNDVIRYIGITEQALVQRERKSAAMKAKAVAGFRFGRRG